MHYVKIKKKYYENLVDNNKHDSKKMWKTLKKLIGNKKQSTELSEVVFDNEIVTSQLSITNKLNNYFVESVDQIIKKINCTDFNKNDFVCIIVIRGIILMK